MSDFFWFSDAQWERIEPLLPRRERRFRYPGRKPLDDRRVLSGILFVLHTGIGWEHLPQELGFGSGMTCWRRLHAWQEAGVWERLHQLLLAELNALGKQSASKMDVPHWRTDERSTLERWFGVPASTPAFHRGSTCRCSGRMERRCTNAASRRTSLASTSRVSTFCSRCRRR